MFNHPPERPGNEIEEGRVQLIDLVAMGQRDAIQELLQKYGDEINLNEMDGNGNLAITVAVRRNDCAMVTLLVSAGVDLSLRDGSGLTAKDWARKTAKPSLNTKFAFG